MADNPEPLIMEEVTEPEELAAIRARRARFERNAAWLQAHISEVYTQRCRKWGSKMGVRLGLLARRLGATSATPSCAFGDSLFHDQINVTIQHMQQSEQLTKRFLVIRLIEETIELRR